MNGRRVDGRRAFLVLSVSGYPEFPERTKNSGGRQERVFVREEGEAYADVSLSTWDSESAPIPQRSVGVSLTFCKSCGRVVGFQPCPKVHLSDGRPFRN